MYVLVNDDSEAWVTVVLPHQLREKAAGAGTLQVRPGTVKQVIDGLDQRLPGIRFSICEETGELRRFVNVFVGRNDVRYLNGLDTDVPPGSVVHVIHSIAGGSL